MRLLWIIYSGFFKTKWKWGVFFLLAYQHIMLIFYLLRLLSVTPYYNTFYANWINDNFTTDGKYWCIGDNKKKIIKCFHSKFKLKYNLHIHKRMWLISFPFFFFWLTIYDAQHWLYYILFNQLISCCYDLFG